MQQNHRINQRFKAVAMGDVARLQPQRFNRHDVAAMQSHQAMRRPHKLHVTPAVGELVGHNFGDWELGNRFNQSFLQTFGQRSPFDGAVVEQRFGFAIRHTFEPRHC